MKAGLLEETWYGTIIELSEGHAKVRSEDDDEAVGGGCGGTAQHKPRTHHHLHTIMLIRSITKYYR